MSPLFRNLFRDPELGYLPWVGAAMSLDEHPTSDTTDIAAGDESGRLFCFLPLPLDAASSLMGLPVHVHGFFALEQNRKYVKWPGAYSFADTYMDKGLLWNQCLLREAVPRSRPVYLLISFHLVVLCNGREKVPLVLVVIVVMVLVTYMDKGLLWNQCLLREAVPRCDFTPVTY